MNSISLSSESLSSLTSASSSSKRLFSDDSGWSGNPVKMSRPFSVSEDQILINGLALEAESGLEQVHENLKIYDDLSMAKLDLNSNQSQVLERQQLKLKAQAGLNVIRQARKFTKTFKHDLEPLCVAYHYQLTTREITKLANNGDKAAKLVLRARQTPVIDSAKYDKFIKSVAEDSDYKFGLL
ncbi:hypothetical protein FF38_05482, partial [Lucilia cuprina]